MKKIKVYLATELTEIQNDSRDFLSECFNSYFVYEL